MKRWFLLPLTLCWLCSLAPAQMWSNILAPSRAVDWSSTSPGVVNGISDASWAQCTTAACTAVTTAKTSATAAQINAALASAPANSYVYLAPGTYSLNNGINMAANVALRGAGPDATFLVFTQGTGCGGQGAQVCFIDSSGYYYGSTAIAPGGSNSATFCGDGASGACNSTYKDGDTTIQLSSVGSAGIVNGQYIYLDQADDNPSATSTMTNGLIVCDNQNPTDGCSMEGGAPGRNVNGVDRNMVQIVQVVSGCSSACKGAGPFSVTITPGLYGDKWNSSMAPGAWWSASNMQHAGLENLSIDSTAVGNSTLSGIYFNNAFNCWVNNVRSISPNRNHVWLWQSAHDTIENSYFFGTQNAASESYGVESYISSDNLVINNIFQQVTAPVMMGPSMGSVYAYNFSVDDYYGVVPSWMQQAFAWNHDAGVLYNLSEGNITSGYWSDPYHGTGGLNTVFRNYAVGWEPGKTMETVPVQLYAYNRFDNFIGNVLGCNNTSASYPGDCGSPTQTTYQTNDGSGAARSIYDLNSGNSEDASDCGVSGGCLVKADPYVTTSLMRWGNYDVVHAATQWNSSEVPSGLTDGYANPVPSSDTLPNSFFELAKPTWWGTMPWPPIGPDVAGGDVPGVAGHVYLTPAANCYLNVMKGPATGTGGVLSFNANTCYGNGVALLPPLSLTGKVVAQ